jgi:hypothetical protein
VKLARRARRVLGGAALYAITVLGFDWGPTPQPPSRPLAEPVGVDIPAIDAHSTLIPLGLNQDDMVEVPVAKTPQQAGWYRYSVRPGGDGPAILLGHIDVGGKPGSSTTCQKRGGRAGVDLAGA